ncbi:hypothetical protein UNPF46_24320 [Bradyrhizobium sp. UNPF46]|uniref:hypothetical protein n=1 Tax=Bradyrhizobium sp. UNPF46 TaxID=1141168 RepID=UPI0011514FEE|nr:hypothetical protein [Bradyrhizobium sp. UNPF46]TQF35742.1 hypothetical protein UNPF46_24320 [Bradyrhizobium sp. UNPF46]
MTDTLLDAIFEVVDFALDLSITIDDTKRSSRPDTVEVPPDPQPLSPAAQRALAEAEEREHAREQAAQAASGTDQAS